MEELTWLKSKGYLHITPQLDIQFRKEEILKKVKDTNFISGYAFFPLIHSIIKERKYKKTDKIGVRAHSYVDSEGKHIRTAKNRPLHYATHMDAIIFGYYAYLLQSRYEDILQTNIALSQSVIAYRKIPIEGGNKNKGTIHFAKEVFDEIKIRTKKQKECYVLTFDIKSFFSSLDHIQLKMAWAKLLGQEKLPDDHYNVFKAATKFSYILKDDLRITKKSNGTRAGFNEKELARIRNNFGINAFFESTKAFRDKIKSGELKIYKYPFRNKKTKQPIGIPQGLPISAVLANLYLLEFDKKIIEQLVQEKNCFYRRYSDDIVIICESDQMELVEKFVNDSMEESHVTISKDKTEVFHFREQIDLNENQRINCCKKLKDSYVPGSLLYLGFEYNGRNTLIKSSNLAKFYRRMILAVKRKSKRAIKIADQKHGSKPVIFRRQLYKLYTDLDLNNTKQHTRWKRLEETEFGHYRLKTVTKKKPLKSNYISYVKRASMIMDEPKIQNQIRSHKKKFNQAISKHLKKRD